MEKERLIDFKFAQYECSALPELQHKELSGGATSTFPEIVTGAPSVS
jgi:hypothetical protein